MFHTITLWTIGVIFLINIFGTIATIGKPREPITPGFAAAVVAIDLLLLAGLVL